MKCGWDFVSSYGFLSGYVIVAVGTFKRNIMVQFFKLQLLYKLYDKSGVLWR
jgi:hypothetical protein